jgi:hypothetical protein
LKSVIGLLPFKLGKRRLQYRAAGFTLIDSGSRRRTKQMYTWVYVAATSTKAPHPFLGKWRWKSAASVGQPSFPLPQQGSTVLSQEADGIHYIAVGIYSDGQTRHTESTFWLDGNSYPVLGGTLGDALSTHQLDSHSLEVTVTRASVLSARVKITISDGGDVVTMQCEAVIPQGTNISWTTISERQTDDC